MAKLAESECYTSIEPAGYACVAERITCHKCFSCKKCGGNRYFLLLRELFQIFDDGDDHDETSGMGPAFKNSSCWCYAIGKVFTCMNGLVGNVLQINRKWLFYFEMRLTKIIFFPVIKRTILLGFMQYYIV